MIKDKTPQGRESFASPTKKSAGISSDNVLVEPSGVSIDWESDDNPKTVGIAVSRALEMIKGLVIGGVKIEEYIYRKLVKKLEYTPTERIVSPDVSLAGPVFEALRYTRHLDHISELYANFLASAMDIVTAQSAHPGFIDVIRSITQDEARIVSHLLDIKVIPIIDIKKILQADLGELNTNVLVSTIGVDASCEFEELAEIYLSNLERIGLVEIPRDTYLTSPGIYDRIMNAAPVKSKLKELNSGQERCSGDVKRYFAKLTLYGIQFGNTCVISRN